ncbi:MAG: GHMP kinase [Chloroflexi bacterium]|nr:GHMP kinase [Chloroflexota bacterium]MCL5274941.1 GHMP kinase [Chloroflexota bacterium]
MLIARAPLRLSFFGGGTDLPAYYERYGGAVLSTSLNKYVYAIMNVSEQNALQITSSDYRTFYRHTPGEPLLWDDGDLSLPRAVFQHFGVTQGVSLFLASESPPGTGLGSSSSVTVALVKAISTACGYKLTKGEVARLACDIEVGKLRKPIGLQDQYASAYGGLNWISFSASKVSVEPLVISQETMAHLESHLLLMFTGAAHDSAQILARQRKASLDQDSRVIESLQAVSDLAVQARHYLQVGVLDRFGALLHEAWMYKKRFAPGVSNEHIDHWYALARNNGALGGKIAGAGGGGFLILYCEDDALDRVASSLSSEGLRRMDFRFESDGARVLFNAGLRLREVAKATADGDGLLDEDMSWKTRGDAGNTVLARGNL